MFLSTSEVARKYGVHPRTVRNALHAGCVQGERRGRRSLLVDAESAEAHFRGAICDETDSFYARLVADWPEFSPEQRDTIAALLRP